MDSKMKVHLAKVNHSLVEFQLDIDIEDIKEMRPDLPHWKAQHVLQRIAREFNEEIIYEGLKQEAEKWANELYPKENGLGAETPTTPEQKET